MKTIKNVLVTRVTSPSGIMKVSRDKGIPTSEVFVRVNFKYGEKEYAVSQKFGFLSRRHYEALINAVETANPVDLDVNIEAGFFNVHEEVSLDELYNSVPKKEVVNNLADLSDLI